MLGAQQLRAALLSLNLGLIAGVAVSCSSSVDCPTGAEVCPCTNGGVCDGEMSCDNGLCLATAEEQEGGVASSSDDLMSTGAATISSSSTTTLTPNGTSTSPTASSPTSDPTTVATPLPGTTTDESTCGSDGEMGQGVPPGDDSCGGSSEPEYNTSSG